MIANREIFGRLNTAAMLPAMRAAITTWRPDAVLREPCEYASAITALRDGIPCLQVGISQAAIEASATRLVAPALTPYGDDVVPALLAAPYLTRFPALLDLLPYADTWRYRVPRRASHYPTGGRAAGLLVYVTFGSVAGSLPVVRSVFGACCDEIWTHLLPALDIDRQHNPTSVIGPMAAALGAGALRGFSVADLQTALAIGAASSGGLRANFGTLAKPMDAGNSARAGVQAVLLTSLGSTAERNILEGLEGVRYQGVFDTFGGARQDPARALDGLGVRFRSAARPSRGFGGGALDPETWPPRWTPGGPQRRCSRGGRLRWPRGAHDQGLAGVFRAQFRADRAVFPAPGARLRSDPDRLDRVVAGDRPDRVRNLPHRSEDGSRSEVFRAVRARRGLARR